MSSDDLIRDRFARTRAAARAIDLDILILGRRDDVRYLTGSEQLWTAGTRPFGAVATLVVGSGDLYVLSTWEEGVSELVPFENLHGISWNAATVAGRLGAVPGLAQARRIGVDGLSPGFGQLLAMLAPDAEVVAADHCLDGARRVKLPAEVAAIRHGIGVAQVAMEAARLALSGGVSENHVAGTAVAAASRHGRLQPADVPTVRATSSREFEQPKGSTDTAIHAGSLVRIDLSFLVEGYEGGLGRTVAVDLAGPTLNSERDRLDEAQCTLVARCRAGATGAEVAAGAPEHWLVRGSGMGFELPVIDARTGHEALLEAGMVLSVESAIFLESFGTLSRRDMVLVGDGEPEVLTPPL
ncbi:MAG: M24 family metallopeptidase [Acidimicrobiia bacterium]|nr:M24 family metallopeptidase [Acidimicrobiia bacterium]